MERREKQIALVAFSKTGGMQAMRLQQLARTATEVTEAQWSRQHSFFRVLQTATVHVPERLKQQLQQNTVADSHSLTAVQDCAHPDNSCEVTIYGYDSLGSRMEKLFGSCDAIICFGATGIVVRSIAPCLQSKYRDPAILVCDEDARFVISLLSGHVGQANLYAKWTAALLDAQPVITTASDTAGVFAVDSWAEENGYTIREHHMVKEITARLLEQKPTGLCSDIPVEGNLPEGVTFCEKSKNPETEPEWGICISQNTAWQPFRHTLHLIPRNLVVGVGCKKGTTAEALEQAWQQVCTEHAGTLSPGMNAVDETGETISARICAVASIDIKKEEQGLLEWASKQDAELLFYTAEELSEVEGDFPVSDFVQHITGVDNVCQRAAAEASRSFVNNREWILHRSDALARCRAEGTIGRCPVPKQKLDGITMAVYEKPMTPVRFFPEAE